MVGGNLRNKDLASFSVLVDGNLIRPLKELEQLGVAFDLNFTTFPHENGAAKAARQRATLMQGWLSTS
ncbi:Hypothetical protein FKW44_023813 [Caligus rogercresseyi]|uniref:Uncharacterized protein n=1 Tax=Caligus rogercresseyi TaxID=217165 RepID=A0A7T8GPL5_CALRO|nr:Hypothetical protein FKW44_023813 [Caligus rogercresseyi]